MRADEFITEKDKLDEVLPLVGLAAKTAGGMLAKGAAKVAGGMLAKGAKAATNVVSSANKPQTMGAADPATPAITPNNVKNQAVDRAKDQVIKPGATINLPTTSTGGPEQYKISRMQGDEVEIENPNPAPGEPKKVSYKKDDIKKTMSL
jgi:hypothetical protein